MGLGLYDDERTIEYIKQEEGKKCRFFIFSFRKSGAEMVPALLNSYVQF